MTYNPENSYSPPPPAVVHTSSMAILSLISGIAGWLGIFGLGGLLAVIFGHLAKGEIRKSGGIATGDGLATAGLVLGYTNIAITLVGLCLFALIFAGAISAPLLCMPFMNDINTSFSMIP
ncbi:MAG: DUF4190 domain-containing protein [Anaerolineaceae bacterium]|nr:DUF4190 domain-containing protein [Anaerolineaceae bacterium]